MQSSADSRSAVQAPEPVLVRLPITLGQFLKVAGMVSTGGEAKHVISIGEVVVNGDTETRRGRQLVEGDIVATAGMVALVVSTGPVGGTATPASDITHR